MKIEFCGKLNKTCKGCCGRFSRSVIVNGVKRDFSGRVNCFKCSPLGENNSYHLDKHKTVDGMHHKRCSRCMEFKALTEFYIPTAGPCKNCAKAIRAEKREEQRQRIVEYKGNQCHDCGGVFPASIYDFHHREPHTKEFNVSRYSTWEKLKPELDKCDLLCPTCHRLRHYYLEGRSHP